MATKRQKRTKKAKRGTTKRKSKPSRTAKGTSKDCKLIQKWLLKIFKSNYDYVQDIHPNLPPLSDPINVDQVVKNTNAFLDTFRNPITLREHNYVSLPDVEATSTFRNSCFSISVKTCRAFNLCAKEWFDSTVKEFKTNNIIMNESDCLSTFFQMVRKFLLRTEIKKGMTYDFLWDGQYVVSEGYDDSDFQELMPIFNTYYRVYSK